MKIRPKMIHTRKWFPANDSHIKMIPCKRLRPENDSLQMIFTYKWFTADDLNMKVINILL